MQLPVFRPRPVVLLIAVVVILLLINAVLYTLWLNRSAPTDNPGQEPVTGRSGVKTPVSDPTIPVRDPYAIDPLIIVTPRENTLRTVKMVILPDLRPDVIPVLTRDTVFSLENRSGRQLSLQNLSSKDVLVVPDGQRVEIPVPSGVPFLELRDPAARIWLRIRIL